MSNQKFRPYFTAEELTLNLQCLKTNPTLSSQTQSLVRYLETFAIKIERGITRPSIELKGTPTQQLTRALELDAPQLGNINKEKGALHAKWIAGQVLSPKELELVHLYRYENDLMTFEEETQYEKGLVK
jgi:hypothetical protein